MRRMLIGAALVMVLPAAVQAQAAAAPETKAEAEARAAALAKQTQNPVADLVSIPFQFNWNTGGGLGDQTLQVINIQPVLPMALDDDWLLGVPDDRPAGERAAVVRRPLDRHRGHPGADVPDLSQPRQGDLGLRSDLLLPHGHQRRPDHGAVRAWGRTS